MSEFKLPKRPVKTNTSNDFDNIRSGISKLDEFDYAWKDYAEKCERGFKKAIKHIEEIERENNLLKVDSMPKQLVEVPQFVADWFEESKAELDYRIWQYIKYWGSHEKDGFYYFMDNGGLKPVQTLIRMKFEGYTVKKEQLYNVIVCGKYLVKKFANDTCHELLNKDELGDWMPRSYQLAEQEIKAIDERYWAFAEKVEDEYD